MSVIIEIIEKYVVISGNLHLDSILFGIIAFISFAVAFGLVGYIFDFFGYYDSDLMGNLHWIIRVLVFGGLTWGLIQVFKFIKWLFSFQWWVYLIVTFLIIIIVVFTYIIKYKNRKQINQKHKVVEVVIKEEPKSDIEPQNKQRFQNKYDKYLCPRCNELLAEREGPYGKFIGCSSYPKCNYTRKRL